jgi:hypothetical protein
MSRRTLAAAAFALTLLGVTGCSGDAPAQTPEEKYDSFEKISKAVGCTELLDDEQARPGEVETKTCIYHNTGFSIQHFPNDAKRESAVAQGLASGEVAYLILDENWALQGQPDDVIAVRDNLGAGELITPDGASSDEPTVAGPQVVAVPYGKLATNQETGQQVRIAKIQANQSVISNVKENPIGTTRTRTSSTSISRPRRATASGSCMWLGRTLARSLGSPRATSCSSPRTAPSTTPATRRRPPSWNERSTGRTTGI